MSPTSTSPGAGLGGPHLETKDRQTRKKARMLREVLIGTVAVAMGLFAKPRLPHLRISATTPPDAVYLPSRCSRRMCSASIFNIPRSLSESFKLFWKMRYESAPRAASMSAGEGRHGGRSRPLK